MHPARFDEMNIQAIAIAVQSVSESTGPARILSALSSHSILPVVDPDSGRLIRVIRDREFLMRGLHPEPSQPNGQRSNKLLKDLPVDASDSLPETLQQKTIPELYGEEDASGGLLNGHGMSLTLSSAASIKEARSLFEVMDQPLVPILDDKNRYTGYCASRQELLKLLQSLYKPPRIGGMATPLGVYMTSGVHISGAGHLGLFATGVMFALMAFLLDGLYLISFSMAGALFPPMTQLSGMTLMGVQLAFMFLSTLAIIRMSPIAGLHAAEHKTINAIENGLALTLENVRAQPREHNRCGTNLMVILMSIQAGWLSLESMYSHLSSVGCFLYIVLWVFMVILFWRKIGRWVQTFFTTREPTDEQIESGIKAGTELLEKYNRLPHTQPNLLMRIWGSGLIQMFVSFGLTFWLITTLLTLLPIAA